MFVNNSLIFFAQLIRGKNYLKMKSARICTIYDIFNHLRDRDLRDLKEKIDGSKKLETSLSNKIEDEKYRLDCFLFECSKNQLEKLAKVVDAILDKRVIQVSESLVRWKNRKMFIDKNLLYMKKTKHSLEVTSRKKIRFKILSTKVMNRLKPTSLKHILMLRSLMKEFKSFTEANIYVSFFPRNGFDLDLGCDIIYVGETRPQGVGYRSITHRWGYSGHDHGAEVRRYIKFEKRIKMMIKLIISFFSFQRGN